MLPMCNSKDLYVLRALPTELASCHIKFHWLLLCFTVKLISSFNVAGGGEKHWRRLTFKAIFVLFSLTSHTFCSPDN